MKIHHVIITALIFISFRASANDADGDGLTNELELQIGTSTTLKDSDGDGGSDYDEIKYECDPTNPKQKIVSLGEWKRPDKGLRIPSRNVVVSRDGKLIEITETSSGHIPIESSSYFISLKSRKSKEAMDKIAVDSFAKSRAAMEAREQYLALSSKYQEIKDLRAKNSRLRAIYNANKTKENLAAWNNVRLPLVELEKKEYEAAVLRVAAARYSKRNRVDELEDRIEELENTIEDLE